MGRIVKLIELIQGKFTTKFINSVYHFKFGELDPIIGTSERVDLDKSKIQESFDHSESFFQTRAWMYPDHIPASKINMDKIMVYDLRK